MVSEINGYMSADDNNKNVLILVLVEDGLGVSEVTDKSTGETS